MGWILVPHVLAGGLALASGSVAMIASKGSRPHRAAGNVFFVSMLVMAITGGSVAALTNHRVTVLAAMLTAYLVGSGWLTAQRKDGGAAWGWLALGAGLSVAAYGAHLGLEAWRGHGDVIDGTFVVPATIYFTFGGVGALGAAGDALMIARRGVSGRSRILRHLWRMCAALYVAASSFFTGQQDVFPEAVQGTFLLQAPELLVLGLLIFWLGMVAFSRRFASTPAAAQVVPAE